MIKTPELESVCAKLNELPPDWDKLVSRFKQRERFHPAFPFTLNQYAKEFSETHLDVCLEELAQSPDSSILLDIGEKMHPTFNYRFELNSEKRWVAYSKKMRGICQEYDKIICVEGLPVVFEVKIRRWETHMNSKTPRARRRDTGNFGNTLRLEKVKEKLFPIRQVFNSDVGYAVIAPKDVYDIKSCTNHNSLWCNFQANNGLIISFYTDRLQFREDVKQVVQDYKLAVREENQSYTIEI